MATRSVLTKPRARDYSHIQALPDPPRVPDMMEQVSAIIAFVTTVELHFADREDVFVGSGGYLLRTPDERYGPYPDGSFADGVEDPRRLRRRNGYVISEVGKPPDLVLEVGSRSTGRRDYTEKREIYAEYGVGEYWRFDPSGGEYHDAPLAGDRLVDGKYEPIEIVSEADGRHWGYSEALGLEFWWDEGELRLWDPVGGRFLPTLIESEQRADYAEQRADYAEQRVQSAERRVQSERVARGNAERRAESERAARDAAEARMAQMEAEIRRLRGDE